MKYCKMDINFRDRINNGRNFRNRRNNRRNDERNSRSNSEEKRNIVSEIWEELNEAFMKGTYISKEKLNDDETKRSNLLVDFDSIKLN